ncbi:MAG: GatB/YqeY domain-containing protein [Chloroflexota bacterium]|nr:GatB/YqeY domain-containing protein [Chloroflexota bacterium]
MTLSTRLQDDLTRSMRERDELRLEALRMAMAAAYNAEKAAGRPLSDDEIVSVLSRELKARRESVEAFAAAGRTDAAAREQAKLEVISEYLPSQLDEEELERLVRETIDQTAAIGPRDMGRVMGALMPKVSGRADGKVASAIVARELARRDLAEHGH